MNTASNCAYISKRKLDRYQEERQKVLEKLAQGLTIEEATKFEDDKHEDVEELSFAKEFAYMELLVAFGYNPQQYLNTILQQVEIIKNTLNTYLPDKFIKTIVRDYANNSHSIICDYFRNYLQRHSARKKCTFLINGVCICVLIKNADKKLREMGAEEDD